MRSRKSLPAADTYEAVFGALAHAARRRVLLTIYFNGGSMTAGEIASIFEHAWQTTTRHLKVLEAAGLLIHERRGRMRIYRIQSKRLELVRDWLAHFSKKDKSGRRNSYASKTTSQERKGESRKGQRKRRSAIL